MLERSVEVSFQGQWGGNTRAGGIGLGGWRVVVVPGGWGVGENPILKAGDPIRLPIITFPAETWRAVNKKLPIITFPAETVDGCQQELVIREAVTCSYFGFRPSSLSPFPKSVDIWSISR